MMNQRTCSHRISELYAEIILKDKFKQEFSIQESFYYDDLFITVFRNHNFKSKLLIVDKHNQNILFENILNESFIIYNNFKDDFYLYSIDARDSKIYKFYSPILNNGLIEDPTNRKHSFISQSIQLTDFVIKNEVIYVTGEVLFPNINKSISDFDQKIGVIDFDIFNQEYSTINFLIGINADNLDEIKGNYFTGGGNLKIWSRDLALKNTVLIEIYNFEYSEQISYIVNYKNNIFKPIHPSYLTQISCNYMLLIPYIESTHYGHYEDFKLIRLSDLKEIDLYNCLPKDVIEYIDSIKLDAIPNDSINNKFIENDVLFFGDYEFSCKNLFSGIIKTTLESSDTISLKSLIPIKGNFFDGYSIEIHTIKSTLKEDGSFETLRTELGELIYKLKYNYDKSAIEPIAQRCADVIKDTFSTVDVIIPAPPSNLNRPFQPVYELAKRISELTGIPVDFNFINKLPTEQIKTLSDQEARNIVLERAISIRSLEYKEYNILLFDDLFRSGDTLNAIAKKLKNDGEVNNIKALCVTKTRT